MYTIQLPSISCKYVLNRPCYDLCTQQWNSFPILNCIEVHRVKLIGSE